MTHPTCQLRLIGGFDLRVDGRPALTRDTGARLLTLLALTGRSRPLSRQSVTQQLWPDDSTARSTGRLRNILWRLPKTPAGPLVVSSGPSLTLAEHVDVDLWRAQATAHRLTHTTAVDATDPLSADSLDLAPFTQDLLPEWPEDWLVLDRESFRQTRLHTLEKASTHLLACGSLAAALQAALTAVACEPLRETAHCRVVEAHLAEGNHAEALRQYQTYRRLLAAELGLAPTPAIRALVAPLLGRPVDHHSPRTSRGPRSNQPWRTHE